jgi:outer membrane lipoprotein LolB
LRFIALIAVLMLAAGCAATRQAYDLPDIGDWDARVAVLGDIREWQFKGRIAVKAGDEGFNGRLSWEQDEEAYRATVSGPLGMGTVRITGDGRSVVLTDKDGVANEIDDVELELRYRYGWSIPVDSLRYWALGIPDPAQSAVTEFDDEGLLRRLEQGGWNVDISRYSEGGGQLMPRILSASNSDTRVRVVIDRWFFFDR